MSSAPWDNPDLDDFESRQSELEGAGDWVEAQADWYRDVEWAGSDWRSGPRTPDPSPGRFTRHEIPELVAPIAPAKRFRIPELLDGVRYVRTERGWLRGVRPVTLYNLTGRLDRKLDDRLRYEDRTETHPGELVRRAWIAQALQQPDRAEELSRRALRAVIKPPDKLRAGQIVPDAWEAEALAAAAMLCSALRQQDESRQALEETEPYATTEYPPLMTSRAAALCDLDRWDEGRALAYRSRDLQDSVEVANLIRRIERHFDTSPSNLGASTHQT